MVDVLFVLITKLWFVCRHPLQFSDLPLTSQQPGGAASFPIPPQA